MTLAAGPVSVVYAGTGSASAFPVANGAQAIPFTNLSDIVVMQYVAATGAITTLVQGTDYTISGTATAYDGGNVPEITNGVVTRSAGALPAGYYWGIYRSDAIAQNTSVSLGGNFSSATVEAALDFLTKICQDLSDHLSRVPYQSLVDQNTGTLQLPVKRAGMLLGFDSAGGFAAIPYSSVISGAGTFLSGAVTLNANATSTTVIVSGCETTSQVWLQPTTQDARFETPSVTCAAGQFVLTHANNANTDRTYSYLLLP
jgi:hypothetical protein